MSLYPGNDPHPAQDTFVAGLRRTTTALRIARLKIALLAGAMRSLHIAGVAIACVAIAILFARLGVIPASLRIYTGAIGAIAIVMLFGVDVFPHVFSKADLQDAAERLDLATDGHNRIATALELCVHPEHTLFETQAIKEGLAQLAQVKDAQPALPDARVEQGWLWSVLPLALVLLCIALMVPGVPRRSAINAVSLHITPSSPLVLTRIDRQTPADGLRRDPAIPPSKNNPQSARSDGDQKLKNLVAQNVSASAAGNGTGPSFGTPDAIAAPPSENAGVGQPSAKSESGNRMELPANGLAAQQKANPASSASSGQSKSPERSQESGSKSSRSQGGKSAGDQDPTGESSGGAGSASNKDPKSSQGGSGSGSGEESAPPPKGSSGSTMAASNSTQSGGDGKSGGQNAPKKSRGVMPMMFGANEPDLFEGKPLPGPDERTTSQVPPIKNPGQLATNSATAAREGDEQSVDRYSVPAAVRDIAGRYFQSFHDDPDQASPIAAGDSR